MRDVVTHPVNRGKAEGLRSGFRHATERGFTHALTIDTDGQHNPADIPPMLALAQKNREAIVVGIRELKIAHYPLANRIGRQISNLLIWLESGRPVADSQCGLRVYPLGPLTYVPTRAQRFGFETEILTRFVWAGGSIAQHPIRCVYDVAGGRTSHYRPWTDSFTASLMHMMLLLRSVIPWPTPKIPDAPRGGGTLFERMIHWFNPLRTWRDLRDNPAARQLLPRTIATGILIGAVPLYGFKTVICLFLAKVLRIPPLLLIATSSAINTPPIGPLVVIVSIIAGHLLLWGHLPRLAQYDLSSHDFWTIFAQVGKEWVLGSVTIGLALALAAYGLIKLCVGPGESVQPIGSAPARESTPASESLQIAPQAE
jgi:uncharacterized protein (DUF2062 family)